MHLTTSAAWVAWFAHNAEHLLNLPWNLKPQLTPEQRAAILPSLQAWQLGETSEGLRFRALARRYGETMGDLDFPAAADAFIREEQRHGETLGQYLDRAGIPRLRRDWGDSMFRWCRHVVGSLEVWVSVVLIIETLALVYYAAIRRATQCPLLRRICLQLLRDEVPHLRFQCERLAIFHAQRGPWLRWLTLGALRIAFCAVALAVWVAHRQALQAGGHTWTSYWAQSWRRMEFAWAQARPERYAELTPRRHIRLWVWQPGIDAGPG